MSKGLKKVFCWYCHYRSSDFCYHWERRSQAISAMTVIIKPVSCESGNRGNACKLYRLKNTIDTKDPHVDITKTFWELAHKSVSRILDESK